MILQWLRSPSSYMYNPYLLRVLYRLANQLFKTVFLLLCFDWIVFERTKTIGCDRYLCNARHFVHWYQQVQIWRGWWICYLYIRHHSRKGAVQIYALYDHACLYLFIVVQSHQLYRSSAMGEPSYDFLSFFSLGRNNYRNGSSLGIECVFFMIV